MADEQNVSLSEIRDNAVKSLCSDTLGAGCDRFLVLVDHVGSLPRYVPSGQAGTAYVSASYNLGAGTAAVIMVDGNEGASITNCAGALLPFIHRLHLGRRGVPWRNVTWVYRDSMGFWDEILMFAWDGGNQAQIGFRPLGDRSAHSVLARVAEAGFVLDGHDLAHLRNAIAHTAVVEQLLPPHFKGLFSSPD